MYFTSRSIKYLQRKNTDIIDKKRPKLEQNNNSQNI